MNNLRFLPVPLVLSLLLAACGQQGTPPTPDASAAGGPSTASPQPGAITAQATGPELCSNNATEYVRIAAHEFHNGRLVVSKHRYSNTMCAVTFNTTGAARYTRATLIRVPAGGGVTYDRREDAGQYSRYAGPIYLQNYYPYNDFYVEGQVGGSSVQLYCTLSSCGVPR